ncbi:hypothetical protein CO046_03630 [Candidatus Peregrinibacteria bacterium CG_4_9_14_0_2_um_filter_53_11]|nr:MAG: hypothetical protein CO046_03630 [Candidatus Peregrinibacteria bacterium CG_4_9_14_0_2_um_filter_53_11]
MKLPEGLIDSTEIAAIAPGTNPLAAVSFTSGELLALVSSLGDERSAEEALPADAHFTRPFRGSLGMSTHPHHDGELEVRLKGRGVSAATTLWRFVSDEETGLFQVLPREGHDPARHMLPPLVDLHRLSRELVSDGEPDGRSIDPQHPIAEAICQLLQTNGAELERPARPMSINYYWALLASHVAKPLLETAHQMAHQDEDPAARIVLALARTYLAHHAPLRPKTWLDARGEALTSHLRTLVECESETATGGALPSALACLRSKDYQSLMRRDSHLAAADEIERSIPVLLDDNSVRTTLERLTQTARLQGILASGNGDRAGLDIPQQFLTGSSRGDAERITEAVAGNQPHVTVGQDADFGLLAVHALQELYRASSKVFSRDGGEPLGPWDTFVLDQVKDA